MRITIKKSPVVFEAQTKSELEYKIMSSFGCTWMYTSGCFGGHSGHGYVKNYKRSDETFIGVSFQKFNHKSKVVKTGKTKMTIGGLPTKRVKVRDAKWVANVYQFKLANLKSFQQGPRTFKVEFNEL